MLKKSFLIKSIIFMMMAAILINGSVLVHANSTHEFSSADFQDQYNIGESLLIPEVNLTVGSEVHGTTAVVYLPSGEAYKTGEVILDQFGEYKVEYRSVVKNKLYSTTYSFIVIEKLYSFINEKSTAVYDVDLSDYKTGHYGVNVSLQRGDILTYNGIIDLSKLDADNPAVQLFVTPQGGFGTKDVGKIVIEFTDIYDKNNRVRVIGNAVDDDGDPGQWWTTSTYMQAGAFDSTTGIEWGAGKVHTNNVWGYPARFSFYGMQAKRSVVGEEFLSVAFDLDEKKVFGPRGSKDNFIVDLDDSNYVTTPWEGFTTGEVSMTITAERYTGTSFNFMITKIGNNDITPEYNYDLVGPAIDIDFEGLDRNNLPKAKLGFTYPVFEATGFDAITKDSVVTSRVFYNYFANQRFELPIKDGRFKVDRAGTFTIEYKSRDNFGNESIELVHVQTTNADSAIDLDFDKTQMPATEVVGTRIDLPAINYEGGFGKLTLSVYAKLGTKIIPINNNYFRPETDGNYQIIVEVVDTVGQKVTSIHNISIEKNNLPVFIEDAVLPKYLISDSNYELDDLKGYDYNTNDYVETKIYVTDGNGPNRLVENNVASFKPDSNGKATITYKATNSNGSREISYVIDVVKVKDPYIDMKAYFVGDNLIKKATTSFISIGNDTNANSSFNFVNYLNGNQFTMRFRINPLQNKFNRLDLYLEDYENNNEKIKVSFIKAPNNENIIVEINDQISSYDIKTTFINGGEINLTYNNFNQTLIINDSGEKSVRNYLDHSVFKGFSSSRVYLSGDIKEISGKSSILISSINGQLLSNDEDDFVKPFVSIGGVYQSTYTHGQKATIFSALAFDVLDPEVISSLTVKDPLNKVVTSLSGLKLENVPFDKDYEINLNTYGSYLVTYTARDTNGSGLASYSYALYVVDNDKPVITVNGTNVVKGKVNQAFSIKPATANDLVDGDVKVTYFIVLPTGVIVHVDDKKLEYTPTIKGVHKIRYYSIDLSGNQVFNDYEVSVD